eukprot:513753-Pleurochrysis_carterae.AAC.1
MHAAAVRPNSASAEAAAPNGESKIGKMSVGDAPSSTEMAEIAEETPTTDAAGLGKARLCGFFAATLEPRWQVPNHTASQCPIILRCQGSV